jgi:TonB family protein
VYYELTAPSFESKNITKPEILKRSDPIYPNIAINKGVTGTVIVICLIGVDGKAGYLQILRGHPLLNQSAMQAVTQYRFKPGMLENKKIPVIWAIPIRYKMRNELIETSDIEYKRIYKDEANKKLTIINWRELQYPVEAKEKSIKTTCKVAFTIDTKGKTKNIEFISGNELFKNSAIQYVSSLVLRPVYKDQKELEYRTSIDVDYKLKNN